MTEPSEVGWHYKKAGAPDQSPLSTCPIYLSSLTFFRWIPPVPVRPPSLALHWSLVTLLASELLRSSATGKMSSQIFRSASRAARSLLNASKNSRFYSGSLPLLLVIDTCRASRDALCCCCLLAVDTCGVERRLSPIAAFADRDNVLTFFM